MWQTGLQRLAQRRCDFRRIDRRGDAVGCGCGGRDVELGQDGKLDAGNAGIEGKGADEARTADTKRHLSVLEDGGACGVEPACYNLDRLEQAGVERDSVDQDIEGRIVGAVGVGDSPDAA